MFLIKPFKYKESVAKQKSHQLAVLVIAILILTINDGGYNNV